MGRTLSAGVLALVAACGSETGSGRVMLDGSDPGSMRAAPPEPVVTDSAGVRIVTSPRHLLDRENWAVASIPLIVVDGTEGGLEPFHRIASMAFDSDSTFLLGEMAMTRLRRYDLQGRFLGSIGFPGQGPGEFGAMNDIVIDGDSLIVWDSRWSRVSWFDTNGTFVRMVRLQNTPWGFAGSYDGFVEPGYLLAHTGRGRETESTYVLFDRDGEPVRRLEAVPGQRRFPVSLEPGGTNRPEYFSAFPHAAPSGRYVARYAGPRYELEVWETGGALRAIFRVDTPARPLTDQMQRSWRRSAVAAAESQGRSPSDVRALERVGLPDSLPSLGASRNVGGPPRILSDDRGRTWVVEYPGQGWQRWLVWAADGALVGVVRLPQRFELEAVRGDLLLGVQKDTLDVETAVALRLVEIDVEGSIRRDRAGDEGGRDGAAPGN